MSVKTQVLAADSDQCIGTNFLVECSAIDCIEVVQNGTIWGLKDEIGAGFSVKGAARAPCDFATEANVVLQNKDATEAGIHAAANRRESGAITIHRRLRGDDGAKTKSAMKLLGLG